MKKEEKKTLPRPVLKWQTGDYERHARFKFILPYQFLLLCRLMEVTPQRVIRDFTINLDCGSWEREGRDKAKAHLINYFIECGYGRHYYTEEDIRDMFKEMDALGMLFPQNNMKMINRYARWRDKHQTWWFKKWYYKVRRKQPK